MKLFKTLILGFTAAAALVSLPAGAAGFKCWTNAEGVRECGEKVPPEFAQEGHQVIKEGMVVDEKERAKTAAEVEEEKRRAAAQEAERRALAEQQRQDKVLLQTYSTVEDLERVRDEQIQALTAQISVTESRNNKIREDLNSRIAKAAEEERAGKPANQALLKDIESLRRQLANNDEAIKARHAEQDAIRADYAARIQRFRELKGLPPEPTAAATQ